MKQSRMALVSNSANSKSCSSDEENELRRGPWTLEEDNLLVNYISCHGEGRWNLLAKCAGLKRNGKSCRLRWLNYLKPDVKRGNLSSQEQLLIIELHSKLGNRWSKIAQYLPGRTDNEIKNYWRTRVQKQARQLKIDSDSESFLDVVRRFWMPNMHHNMKQAASLSSYSTLPNSIIRPPLNNQVPLSSSPTPSTLFSVNHGNGTFDPVIGASVPLSPMQNSNLSEILNDPPNPCAFGDNIFCNPFLDANYSVDSSSHDMEAYNLAPTSTTPIDDTSYLDYQMPEGDWASLDDVKDARSIWNMNELWQFGRPE